MNNATVDRTAIRLHPKDNVAVLLKTAESGSVVAGADLQILARERVPRGHKVATQNIGAGQPIIKYGQVIGFARKDIQAGQHVHSHNVELRELRQQYDFCADAQPVTPYGPEAMRYFRGYPRANGRVGTRNYVAVIAGVNCSASAARYVAERFKAAEFRRDFPNVDGVVAFTHKSGCAMPPGEPLELLQRVLIGISRHPNIGGCIFIGLGCEVNQLALLRERAEIPLPPQGGLSLRYLVIQEAGGLRKTVDAAARAVQEMLPRVNAVQRVPQPVSKLVLATNCGGSDAYSGITANPALGIAADELVRYGGTAVLAETPEIYGAEHLLVRRAISTDVGQALLERVRWWQGYVRQHGASIDNNPSDGNKAGGLTTIYEKSLGAIAKGGHSPLMAVYRYAERIDQSGFCFMDTPGFDPVSMTGLVAGGCHIAVFTTGRGSVYGCKPTPCIKVASNTPLFARLADDMDLNAGTIVDGVETVEQTGLRLFDKLIQVASGESTRSESAGLGDEEFAPWILGPVL